MQSISTIGLDIAKSIFQVHGVDAVTRHERAKMTQLTRSGH